MTVTIDLPEKIERQLTKEWGELSRKILEATAVEGYRQEILSRGQVGEMLGLDFWETEAFLKERGAWLHYTAEDLEQDRLSNEQALSK